MLDHHNRAFCVLLREAANALAANVAASGATRLVLDCPGCAMQLAGGADRLKTPLRVTHIAELLAEAL